jgi:flavin reductase (DIM6/NTAB) family NADH-FMN oxidoreductase RutF
LVLSTFQSSSRNVDYAAVELDGSVHVVSGHVVSGHVEVGDGLEFGSDVDDEAFKAAMRVLAAGVVMVTTWFEGRPWGLTISSCCSVTVEPPQILISLRSSSVSCREINRGRRFGVSILGARQKPLAELGAAVGVAKFIDDYCNDQEALRSPMIEGALYHLDCSVASTHSVGDHSVIIGRVLNVVFAPRGATDRDPLLYFDRSFWTVGRQL